MALAEATRQMVGGYGYEASTNGRYVLSRDGKELLRGTEAEVWAHMHRILPYSISHALEFEGYGIEPEVPSRRA